MSAQEAAPPEEEQQQTKVIEDLKFKQHPGLAYAASKIYFSDRKYSISGFGETNAVLSGGEQDKSGGDLELYYTNLYRFSVFLGYKIRQNLIFNFEFLGELLHDGRQEIGNDIVVEAMVDWILRPSFNLRFGYFPLPMGYLNNNDEPVMFRSVNRPEVERLIIPSSWIMPGAMAFGALGEKASWSLGVVEGLRADDFIASSWVRQGRGHGLPKDAAAFGQAMVVPSDKLQMGLSGYGGHSGAPLPGGGRLRLPTYLGAAHVHYRGDPWQVTAVAAKGALGRTPQLYELTGELLGNRTYGWYFEPSYNLLPRLRGKQGKAQVPVFLRYERLNTRQRVAEPLRRRHNGSDQLRITAVGLNYLPKRHLAFKANYQFRRVPAGGRRQPNLMEFGIGFVY